MAIRLPTRLPARHPARKWIAAAVIAVLAASGAVAFRFLPGTGRAVLDADDVLYNALYSLRTPEDRMNGGAVILTVDDKALGEMNAGKVVGERFGWPWPRHAWAVLIPYLEQHGARVVVLDILFSETSIYEKELQDDTRLGEVAAAAKVPVVFATYVTKQDTPGAFAPPVPRPTFGAANADNTTLAIRTYSPFSLGVPSLAYRAAATMAGGEAELRTEPFRLHFYGPYKRGDDVCTPHRYLSVGNVVAAAVDEAGGVPPRDHGFDPAVFKGKAVFVGSTAAGLGDLKSTAYRDAFPGVEVHTTAMENLLERRRVHEVGPWATGLATVGGALLASLGVVLPRRTASKLAAAALTAALLLAVAVLLFRGRLIYWLPLAVPLLALVLATIVAMAWSYLTEGRQRQFFFRALSQYLSPDVAEVVERSGELSLGGERRELTVMFSDIQGFTDLSEALEERITDLLNYYLGEMSAIVYATGGTLDKYIGDAIMSFWNAPVPQPDHAARACRTALEMKRREAEIQPKLAALGGEGMLTRIGLHTGPMTFGNMGSPQKFNYTVIGDAVNLGSRLEGSNKLYGSTILISQTTADGVHAQFVIRQLDLLQVKGKKKPMAVYELMAEGTPDADLGRRVAGYEAALNRHWRRDWDGAEAELNTLLAEFPADAPAKALLKRIDHYRHEPPPPEWDGVYISKTK